MALIIKPKKAKKVPDSGFTKEEKELIKRQPGARYSIDLSARTKDKLKNYAVHMVSFRNLKEISAYNIINNDDPFDWQIVLLEQYLNELKAKLRK